MVSNHNQEACPTHCTRLFAPAFPLCTENKNDDKRAPLEQLWNQVLQAAGCHRQPKLKNPFELLSLLLVHHDWLPKSERSSSKCRRVASTKSWTYTLRVAIFRIEIRRRVNYQRRIDGWWVLVCAISSQQSNYGVEFRRSKIPSVDRIDRPWNCSWKRC